MEIIVNKVDFNPSGKVAQAIVVVDGKTETVHIKKKVFGLWYDTKQRPYSNKMLKLA